MKITPIQEQILHAEICPYCKAKTEYIDSIEIYKQSYGMIYICRPCDAYVGVHKGTNNAKGRLANKELRELKKQAHHFFDTIWQTGQMNRGEAHKWLSYVLGIPSEYCHIGMFSDATCEKVIQIAKDYLSENQ